MLNDGQRYPFIDRTNSTGQISTLPYFPIVILGHMNFFAEFNVCFYRHESAFEIHPRSK
jgi:hypothetical protein